jgi:hypothetical protein
MTVSPWPSGAPHWQATACSRPPASAVPSLTTLLPGGDRARRAAVPIRYWSPGVCMPASGAGDVAGALRTSSNLKSTGFAQNY